MKARLIVVAASIAVALSTAPASVAAPSCRDLREADYGMFSDAGDRAVGRVVESVAPRCGRRVNEATVLRRVRAGLRRVARRYDEVEDSAVLDAVADALEDSGAVRAVDSLDAIRP